MQNIPALNILFRNGRANDFPGGLLLQALQEREHLGEIMEEESAEQFGGSKFRLVVALSLCGQPGDSERPALSIPPTQGLPNDVFLGCQPT